MTVLIIPTRYVIFTNYSPQMNLGGNAFWLKSDLFFVFDKYISKNYSRFINRKLPVGKSSFHINFYLLARDHACSYPHSVGARGGGLRGGSPQI